jgi:hypothetical protein
MAKNVFIIIIIQINLITDLKVSFFATALWLRWRWGRFLKLENFKMQILWGAQKDLSKFQRLNFNDKSTSKSPLQQTAVISYPSLKPLTPIHSQALQITRAVVIFWVIQYLHFCSRNFSLKTIFKYVLLNEVPATSKFRSSNEKNFCTRKILDSREWEWERESKQHLKTFFSLLFNFSHFYSYLNTIYCLRGW